MVHIDLSAGEQELLGEILRNYISDLSNEIADTDDFDFRKQLKAKRDVLVKILDSVQRARE